MQLLILLFFAGQTDESLSTDCELDLLESEDEEDEAALEQRIARYQNYCTCSDTDPDPALFVSGLQDVNKKYFFGLLACEKNIFTSFFMIKSHKKVANH